MGNKLREYRKICGITQRELSKQIGISRQYLSDIENCKKQPTIKIAFDCAKVLGVPIESIFYYID